VRSRSSAVSDRECQDFSSCSLWHASVRQSPRIQTTSSLFICFAQHAGYGSSRYHPVRLKVSTSSGETVCDSFRTLRVLKPPSGSLLLIVSRNSGSARLKQGEATRAQVIPRLGPITEGARFSPCCYCCSPLLHRSTPRDHHRKENKQRRRKGERKRREEEHSPSPNADPPSTPGALSVKGRGDHVERPISYIASKFDQRPYHHRSTRLYPTSRRLGFDETTGNLQILQTNIHLYD
jgi:hypothetical protein